MQKTYTAAALAAVVISFVTLLFVGVGVAFAAEHKDGDRHDRGDRYERIEERRQAAHERRLDAYKRVCDRIDELKERFGDRVNLPKPHFCEEVDPPVLPTVHITADPTSIEVGDSAELSWETANADTCTAEGGWSGDQDTSGSLEVMPATTTTYTLTCQNEDGETSDSATVTVTEVATATLTLMKTVVNDDGGEAEKADFQAKIDGDDVGWDVTHTVEVGEYTVSEVSIDGYAASAWGGDCAADGTVTLEEGDEAICTITNDDIAPTLTLVKTVVNDDEGSATTTDFQAKINEVDVAWDVAHVVVAGDHIVSEDVVEGYVAGDWGGDCSADGSITLMPGDEATCTITNDDIDPEPTLTFTGDPLEVLAGATSTLMWDSEHTNTCTAEDGWSGDKVLGGSEDVFPATSTTYTLTCVGDGGEVEKSVDITVVEE